jgi:hypothetical protein
MKEIPNPKQQISNKSEIPKRRIIETAPGCSGVKKFAVVVER